MFAETGIKNREKLCCQRQITASPRGRASTIAVHFVFLAGFLDNSQLEAKADAPPPHVRGQLESDWIAGGERRVCWRFFFCLRRRGSGSAVVFLLLAVVLLFLRLSETLLEEVDEGLAQMLPGAVAVQEVTFVRVDLQRKARAGDSLLRFVQCSLLTTGDVFISAK